LACSALVPGFRAATDTTLRDSAIDAVEGVALAIVLVVAMLALLGEVDSSTPLAVVLGKAVYEVLPVCVGIGVANSILREQSDDDTSDADGEAVGDDEPAQMPLNATVADLGEHDRCRLRRAEHRSDRRSADGDDVAQPAVADLDHGILVAVRVRDRVRGGLLRPVAPARAIGFASASAHRDGWRRTSSLC